MGGEYHRNRRRRTRAGFSSCLSTYPFTWVSLHHLCDTSVLLFLSTSLFSLLLCFLLVMVVFFFFLFRLFFVIWDLDPFFQIRIPSMTARIARISHNPREAKHRGDNIPINNNSPFVLGQNHSAALVFLGQDAIIGIGYFCYHSLVHGFSHRI